MHPVIELINKRISEKSDPQNRNDNYKIGLAIEGGGMRGLVSAGMVAGLESISALNAFDVVYGSSAGAINGAFFIAGQASYGTTIYYEDINNNNFIDVKRLFSKSPVLSLKFLLSDVMINRKILDWNKVIHSNIPLVVVASGLNKVEAVHLKGFKSRSELFDSFHASANMPRLGGEPIKIGNELYLDASIFESIPYHAAIKDNCTHVLALRTRPEGVLRGKPSLAEKYIIARYLHKFNPKISDIYLQRAEKYSNEIDYLRKKTSDKSSDPYIYTP